MAKPDGIALRGKTRGFKSLPVRRMAAGGNVSGRDAAMGGSAPGSRAEASRGTSGGGQSNRSTPSSAGRAGGLSTGGGGAGRGGGTQTGASGERRGGAALGSTSGAAAGLQGGSGPRRGGAALGTKSNVQSSLGRVLDGTGFAAAAREKMRSGIRSAAVDTMARQRAARRGDIELGQSTIEKTARFPMEKKGLPSPATPESANWPTVNRAAKGNPQVSTSPPKSSAMPNIGQPLGDIMEMRGARKAVTAPGARSISDVMETRGRKTAATTAAEPSKAKAAIQSGGVRPLGPARGVGAATGSYPSISSDARAVVGRTAKGLTQTVGIAGTSKPFGSVNRGLANLLGGTTDSPKEIDAAKAKEALAQAKAAGAFVKDIDPALAARLNKKDLAEYTAVPKGYSPKAFGRTVVSVKTGFPGFNPNVTFGYPKNITTPAKVTNRPYSPSPPAVAARAQAPVSQQSTGPRGFSPTQPSNLGGTPGPRDIVGPLNQPARVQPTNLGGSLGIRDIVGPLNRPAPALSVGPTRTTSTQGDTTAVGRLNARRTPTSQAPSPSRPTPSPQPSVQRGTNFGAAKDLARVMGKGSQRSQQMSQEEIDQRKSRGTTPSTTGTIAQSGTAAMKKGGMVRRRDGAAMSGRTKGKYI